MMFKTCLAAIAAAGLLATPLVARAQTQTITFDDDMHPCAQVVNCWVEDGYHGLNWNAHTFRGFWAVEGDRAVSGDYYAATTEETPLDVSMPDGYFDLNSLYLSTTVVTTNPNHSTITLMGTRDGVLIGSMVITPSDTMVKYDLDWAGINAFEVTDYTHQLLFDDIVITPTPEPATIGMTALGLVAILAAVRRRRRNSVG